MMAGVVDLNLEAFITEEKLLFLTVFERLQPGKCYEQVLKYTNLFFLNTNY